MGSRRLHQPERMACTVGTMLIVLSGLPGAGKTTIAREFVASTRAAYLRIDAIEQSLLASGGPAAPVGVAGYLIAHELARSNLELGMTVLVDCVNPVTASRNGWRAIAAGASSRILEVEVICSDVAEHRRRVEDRSADIAGHVLPSWEDVCRHEYEPWTTPRLVIDTAVVGAALAAGLIAREAGRHARAP
jgi:predicted kinase